MLEWLMSLLPSLEASAAAIPAAGAGEGLGMIGPLMESGSFGMNGPLMENGLMSGGGQGSGLLGSLGGAIKDNPLGGAQLGVSAMDMMRGDQPSSMPSMNRQAGPMMPYGTSANPTRMPPSLASRAAMLEELRRYGSPTWP